MERLAGQLALVTGASRGIGRAVAAGLAAEGAAVALVSRSQAQLDEVAAGIAAAGGQAIAVAADVTDGAEVDGALAEVRRRLGDPTLLVNNAGTAAAIGPIWEVDPAVWWQDVATSLRGAFLCSRGVLPAMLAASSGRIVNMSSYVGIRPSPYLSAYGAAKASLVNLTESLAAEAAPAGVRVFAVSPGHVRTELVRNMLESDDGRRWLPHVAESKPVAVEKTARLLCALAAGDYDVLSGTFLHALDDVDDLARRADEIIREEQLVPRLRR